MEAQINKILNRNLFLFKSKLPYRRTTTINIEEFPFQKKNLANIGSDRNIRNINILLSTNENKI